MLRDMRGAARRVPAVALAFALAAAGAAAANALQMGEDVAKGLGQRIGLARAGGVAAVTLLTGSAVAVSGPIAFVGLVVPHIARRLIGSSYHLLLPASLLVGGAFLVLTDLVARVVLAPAELPIGVVTAFIGAPFFAGLLWIGARRR